MKNSNDIDYRLQQIFEIDRIKSKNVKSLCNENEDCDIDKIAEKLIKKGRDKPFPSITSN